MAHNSCLINVAGIELHADNKVVGSEGTLCEFSPEAGACRWAPPRIKCQELIGAAPFWVCLMLKPGSHPRFLPAPTPALLSSLCLFLNSLESALPFPLSSSLGNHISSPDHCRVIPEILASNLLHKPHQSDITETRMVMIPLRA